MYTSISQYVSPFQSLEFTCALKTIKVNTQSQYRRWGGGGCIAIYIRILYLLVYVFSYHFNTNYPEYPSGKYPIIIIVSVCFHITVAFTNYIHEYLSTTFKDIKYW